MIASVRAPQEGPRLVRLLALALLLGLGLSACSDDSAPAEAISALIGAEGGTLDLGAGVTLQIPSGALSAPTDIVARIDAAGAGQAVLAMSVAKRQICR